MITYYIKNIALNVFQVTCFWKGDIFLFVCTYMSFYLSVCFKRSQNHCYEFALLFTEFTYWSYHGFKLFSSIISSLSLINVLFILKSFFINPLWLIPEYLEKSQDSIQQDMDQILLGRSFVSSVYPRPTLVLITSVKYLNFYQTCNVMMFPVFYFATNSPPP